VWDVSETTLPEVYADLKQLPAGGKMLIVCNKMDRNPYFKTEWLLDPTLPDIHPYLLGAPGNAQLSESLKPSESLDAAAILPVSAKNQMNIEYLKEKLYDTAIGEGVTTESTVVTNARHHDALRRADEALADVLHSLETGITGDFVAMDIRRSLACLGEITGEIGVEDLLGNIFSKFCIGK
jgi:tRNA modification GTPase